MATSRDDVTEEGHVETTARLAPETLRAAYLDLLVPAIPADELVGVEEFCSLYGATSAIPGFVALDGTGRAMGIAVGERHEATGIALLAYLAVDARRRSRGIGGVLVAHLQQTWGADPAVRSVVAEVEDPREHAANAARADPRARMRFYRRLGARRLPVEYFQPRLAPHLRRVGGMALLSLLPDRPDIDAAALLTYVDDYLLGCEGAVPSPGEDLQYARWRSSVQAWGDTVPGVEIGPELL